MSPTSLALIPTASSASLLSLSSSLEMISLKISENAVSTTNFLLNDEGLLSSGMLAWRMNAGFDSQRMQTTTEVHTRHDLRSIILIGG